MNVCESLKCLNQSAVRRREESFLTVVTPTGVINQGHFKSRLVNRLPVPRGTEGLFFLPHYHQRFGAKQNIQSQILETFFCGSPSGSSIIVGLHVKQHQWKYCAALDDLHVHDINARSNDSIHVTDA